MDHCEQYRTEEAENANVQTDREKLQEIMVIIVDDRSRIIVNSPRHLHQK